MNRAKLIFSMVLTGAAVFGCDSKKEETAKPADTSTAPAVPAMPSTMPSMPTVSVPATLPVPTTTPTLTTPPVTLPPTTLSPTTLPSIPTPSASNTTTTTTVTPTPGGSASTDDAKALLADAAKNVSDKKWDAAGDDFKKLNAMRSKLSPDLQQAITEAEAKFVAAKSGISLPNLPNLGGTPDPNK